MFGIPLELIVRYSIMAVIALVIWMMLPEKWLASFLRSVGRVIFEILMFLARAERSAWALLVLGFLLLGPSILLVLLKWVPHFIASFKAVSLSTEAVLLIIVGLVAIAIAVITLITRRKNDENA